MLLLHHVSECQYKLFAVFDVSLLGFTLIRHFTVNLCIIAAVFYVSICRFVTSSESAILLWQKYLELFLCILTETV